MWFRLHDLLLLFHRFTSVLFFLLRWVALSVSVTVIPELPEVLNICSLLRNVSDHLDDEKGVSIERVERLALRTGDCCSIPEAEC